MRLPWGLCLLAPVSAMGCSPQLDAPDATFAARGHLDAGGGAGGGDAAVARCPGPSPQPPYRDLSAAEPRERAWFGHAGALLGEQLVVVAPSVGSLEPAGVYGADTLPAGMTKLPPLSVVETVGGEGVVAPSRLPFFGGLGPELGGYAVAVEVDVLVVGIAGADGGVGGPVAADSGRVAIYRREASGFALSQSLVAPAVQPCALFGYDVAISGDVLAIGAPGESTDSTSSCDRATESASGAVHLYRDDGGAFRWEATLRGSGAVGGAAFGASLDLRDGHLAVGAPLERSGAPDRPVGAAYVFADDGGWSEEQHLTEALAGPGALYGVSVALDTDVLLVGAPLEATCREDAPSDRGGRVYAYGRTSTRWDTAQCLTGMDPTEADLFGWSFGLSGDRLVVGAPFANRGDGAAHAFLRLEAGFDCRRGLEAPSRTFGFDPVLADAVFGSWVAVSGDRVAIGAPRAPVDGATEAGRVYVLDVPD